MTEIYVSDDKETSYGMTDMFARMCQHKLNLNFYPAQSFCNAFTQNKLSAFIGSDCSIDCAHGIGTGESQTECTCFDGYWGAQCDQECPGGAPDSCSGYGTCDQTTGVCPCPKNRKGDDCGVCATGWYGSDCSVTVTDISSASSALAFASHTGTMYNLDGVSYVFTGVGEYHLLSFPPNFIIQGRFVLCYDSLYCLASVGLRLGDSSAGFGNVTIEPPYPPKIFPTVVVNGDVNTVVEDLYFGGVTISRESALEVKVQISLNSGSAEVIVRAISGYLQLSISIAKPLISSSSGLLSGSGATATTDKLEKLISTIGYDGTTISVCTDSNVQDLKGSASGSVNVNSPSPTTQRSAGVPDLNKYSTQDMCHQWLVDSCDSVFQYSDDRRKEYLLGGRAVYIDGTSVYTMSYESLGTDLTIEILVHKKQDGTIFSYASTVTFRIYTDSDSIKIAHGNSVWDSELTMESNKWTKIVFVYEGSTGKTIIYFFDATSKVHKRETVLDQNIFDTGSTIALGHWQPPNNAENHAVPSPFVGTIDNLRVWNVRLTPDVIGKVRTLNGTVDAAGIDLTWNFNNDVGKDMIRTAIGSGNLQKSRLPWHSASQVPSDIPYPETVSFKPATVEADFEDDAQMKSASNQCAENISPLSTTCTNLDTATIDFYYMSCMRDIKSESHLGAGLRSMLLLADVCKTTTSVPTWPASDFCSETLIRQGTSCDSVNCKFGYKLDGDCQCFSGYAGANCDSGCPVSGGSVCGGHGMCGSSATCECNYNWKGDSECTSCTTGYHGSDCSLLHSTPPAGKKIALVTVSGSYLTFDGAFFQMVHQAGAFKVIDTASLAVYVHQIICDSGACVDALLLNDGTATVEVVAPMKEAHPVVHKDSLVVALSRQEVTVTPNLKAGIVSDKEVYVHFYDASTVKLKVNIKASLNRITIAFKSETSLCTSNSGLFGSCDGNRNNDLTGSTLEQSAKERSSALTSNYKADTSDASFENVKNQNNTQAGYSLKFSGNVALTEALSYDLAAINGGDFTLSFMVKAQQFGGVILSYGKDKVFSFNNGPTFTMTCDGSTTTTSASNTLNKWSQVVVAYKSDTNEMHFYHLTDTEVMYEVLQAPCSGIFDKGGKLYLGKAAVLPGSGPSSAKGDFYGEIDELSIWNFRMSHDQVLQVWNLDVNVKRFAYDLAYLYKFREGTGCITHDLRSGNNLRFSCTDSEEMWVASDHAISSVLTPDGTIDPTTEDESKDGSENPDNWGEVPTDETGSGHVPGYGDGGSGTGSGETDSSGLGVGKGDNTTDDSIVLIPEDEITETKELADNITDAVENSDSPLDDALIEAIIEKALDDGIDNQDPDSSLPEIASVLIISEAADDNTATTAVIDAVCGDKVNMNTYCEDYFEKCIHGAWDYVNLQCYCNAGYYGTERCDEECPGGVETPCNNKGKCLTNGVCECEGHWSGDMCNVCEEGYTGSDCSIITLTLSPEEEKVVVMIDEDGEVLTDDVGFDLEGVTEEDKVYNLFSVPSENLTVYGTLEPCDTGMCLDTVVIERNDEILVINKDAINDDSSVAVWTDTITTENVYTSTTFEDSDILVEVNPDSSISIKSTVENSSFTGNLVIKDGKIEATLTVSSNETTGGILGDCNFINAVKTQECENVDHCDENQDVDALNCAIDVSPETVADYFESVANETKNDVIDHVKEVTENSDLVNNKTPDAGKSNDTSTSGDDDQNHDIYIEETGISTGPMPYVFPSPEFNIEVIIKPENEGVIAAYGPAEPESGTNITFGAVDNDDDGSVLYTGDETATFELVHGHNGVEVHYKGIVYDTGLELPADDYSQINVQYDYKTDILEVIVTPVETGETMMSQIQLDDDAFQPNGELSIGASVPGTDSLVSEQFVGYVDELRVYDKKVVPDEVSDLLSVETTPTTPGLVMLWTFNGEDPLTDDIHGISMESFVPGEEPTIVPSENTLKEVEGITDPEEPKKPRLLTPEEAVTTGEYDLEDPSSPTPEELSPQYVEEEQDRNDFASETCNNTFSDSEIMDKCGSVDDVVKNKYIDKCIKDVLLSGQEESVTRSLEAFILYCENLLDLEESLLSSKCNIYPTVSVNIVGEFCNETCSYGTFKDGTCICDGAHYGSECSENCPATTHGICNGFGSCDSSTGVCPCPPRTSGIKTSLRQMISSTGSPANEVSQCTDCAEGWYGVDCSVAMMSVNENNTGDYVSMVMNTAVKTFDGMVFHDTSPGAFKIMKLERNDEDPMEVQGIFEPCPGEANCRRLTHVLFKRGTTLIKMAAANYTVDVSVYSNGEEVSVPYPYNLNYPAGSGLQLDWDNEDVARVQMDTKAKFIVGASNGELGFTSILDEDFAVNVTDCLCGNNNQDVLDDINHGRFLPNGTLQEVTDEYFLEHVLSSSYISRAMTEKYSLTYDEVFWTEGIEHAINSTGAGHMLRVEHQTVEFSELNVQLLEQFTMTGWGITYSLIDCILFMCF